MIRDRNIDNDAAIQVHKILGSAGLFLTGELFWVGTSGDAAYNKMRARVKDANLFTSLDTAFGSCVANRGDVIAVMEGHDQTVSAAAALAMDIAGVTVIFLGHGTQHAKITFDTATDADMDIDAANITLIRPKFVAGIDSLIGPIDINSTDFTIIDVEYHDADNIETLDAVIATAGATRLKIDGYKYFCGAETGDLKQSHIQLNGCDDIDLKNIDIRGDFFVGNVENVTDEVLNARLEDIYLENVNATPTPALFLDADATGSCKNVKLKIASGTTYVSNVGKMSWDDRCEGFMGDGYAGEPLGTVLGSGLEGKIDVIDGLHDVPTADAVTNLYMRDVVGIKTDAAAAGAVSTTESLMAYIKQAITLAIARDTALGTIDGLHDVPVVDAATNLYLRDVVGIKTDAAINAVTTTKTLMAYLKGVLNEITVPAQNNTDNAFINDVIGQKTDAAAAGAVTTTDTLAGYIKQLVAAAIADAAQTLKLDGVTIATDPVAASLASFIASGGTSLGTQLPASFSLLDMVLGKKVPRAAADVFDGSQTPLFTIAGGRVCIRCLMGEVSVAAIDAGASNTSFVTNPTVGTDAAMCAVLDINADENGTIYAVTGNPSVALQGGSGGGASCMDRCFIVPEGTIDLLSAADVGTGGALGAFEIWWVPIDTGATLVVA